MIHDTKNVGKPTVLTCRFPTFYGCLLHLEGFEGFIKFMVGYTDETGGWNPFHPIGVMAVGIIVGTDITYWLQQRMVLKNQ